jgi:O-Antigen ligase
VRRAVTLLATGVVLAGPTALAFFSGGYFDEPRLVAAIVAWALVLVAAVASPCPLPTSWPGRAALAGLALMCAWTAVSLAWAPLASPASDNVVRLLLYLGALVAAAALLRDRARLRALEPALAFGALIVVGYGLSGRLLPGLIDLERSARAGGRLDQPITYWNAEGALAAMGLVLCARLAGDASRPATIRALGAAACAPLGAAVYLSYSRGAIAAAVVGLFVLLAVAPSRSQLRGIAIAVAAALVAASVSAAFPGVASLEGSLAERETHGAVMLAVMLAVMAAAGLASAWALRGERSGRLEVGRLAGAHRLPAVAASLVALTVAGLVVGGLLERGGDDEASARQRGARLTSLESRRYDYWRIGVGEFADHPVGGAGAAGFRVVWLRERPALEGALDVHSLPLEMAMELGLVGLLTLALFLAGVGLAARRALHREPGLLAGAAAAATVWLLHATIDWDWQVPAVTLPALVMAGALIAAGEGLAPADSAA